jgi:hypothetical protein
MWSRSTHKTTNKGVFFELLAYADAEAHPRAFHRSLFVFLQDMLNNHSLMIQVPRLSFE